MESSPTHRRIPSGHAPRSGKRPRARIHGTWIILAVLGAIYGLATPQIAGVQLPWMQQHGASTAQAR